MRKERLFVYFIILFSVCSYALASGDSHGEFHFPVTIKGWFVFLAPVFNLSLLLFLLVWKLKKPLHDYFVKSSVDISNTLERVELKSKEANLMLESEKKKNSNLQSEVNRIRKNAEEEVEHFKRSAETENANKISKLKSDMELKIKAEEKLLKDELNTELLNSVIAITKSTIKENNNFQEKVSKKLLKQL